MSTQTATAKIQVSCKNQGTLTIPSPFSMSGDFSTSGNLADYSPASAEALHKIASGYDWIERNPKQKYDVMNEYNGTSYDRIRGSEYTLKMAENDFKKHSA